MPGHLLKLALMRGLMAGPDGVTLWRGRRRYWKRDAILLSLPRHLSTLKVALATRSLAPAMHMMARGREPELCGDVPMQAVFNDDQMKTTARDPSEEPRRGLQNGPLASVRRR